LGDVGFQHFKQWKKRISGTGCSQYEAVFYQLCGLFSPRKNKGDGQWLLQMQWNELMKELTCELEVKEPWLGKSCSVK